jgi:hypothetical protein
MLRDTTKYTIIIANTRAPVRPKNEVRTTRQLFLLGLVALAI